MGCRMPFIYFNLGTILNNLPCDFKFWAVLVITLPKFPWESSRIGGTSEYGPWNPTRRRLNKKLPSHCCPLLQRRWDSVSSWSEKPPKAKVFFMQEDFEGGSAVGSAGSVGSLQSQRWYLSFQHHPAWVMKMWVRFRATFWVSGSGMEGLARLFRKERIVQDSDIENGKMGTLSLNYIYSRWVVTVTTILGQYLHKLVIFIPARQECWSESEHSILNISSLNTSFYRPSTREEQTQPTHVTITPTTFFCMFWVKTADASIRVSNTIESHPSQDYWGDSELSLCGAPRSRCLLAPAVSSCCR